MRTHAMRLAVGIVASLLMAACGGDDDDDGDGGGGAASCAELAAIIGDCGGEITEEEFLSGVCDLLQLSGDCLDEAAAADCAEHDAQSPSYQETCFPSCSDTDTECRDGDTLRICSDDGFELVVFCDAACAQTDSTYTGTCANELDGMASPNGDDICWCE